MSTTTLAVASQATMQALLASLTPAQIAALATMAQAQQQHNSSGAESDPALVALWLKTRGKGKLRTMRAYALDVSEFFTWLGGHDVSTTTVVAKIHGQQVTEQLTYITGGKALADLKATDLVAYKEALASSSLAPSSQGRRLSAVRSMLSYGQTTGYLQWNVGAAVKPDGEADGSEVGETQRILTEAQVLAMIHKTEKQRDHLLLKLLYALGCRVGELVALTWGDLDVQGEAVVARIDGEKAGRVRFVTLTGELAERLAQLKALHPEADPVLASQKGGHLDPSQVQRIVRQAAQRAGISKPVSPHWFRHSHASHALDRGAPPHLVRETLGHSSLDITTGYAHAKAGASSSAYLPV